MSSGPSYHYTWTASRPAVARLSTSRTELVHISIAFVVLTADLVILLGGGGLFFGRGQGLLAYFSVWVVLVSAAAVLTGFLCHELAHKFYAQRHGFWAEFRMSPSGLLFSLVTAVIGFLWAVPGATVINGMSYQDREHWGRTSLAGPVTNALFGAVFYLGAVAAFVTQSWFYSWLVLLAWFNAFFATFNLIPVGPLDGAKVLRWRASVWAVAMGAFAAFTVVTYLMLYGFVTPFLGR